MQDTNGASPGKLVSVCTMEDEILIDRPPEVVWDKAVKETGRWWREDLKKVSLGVHIEDYVGGRIWEQYDAKGSGLLYGTVVAIDPPRLIHFTSSNGIAGVALSAYTWQFNRCAGGTLVNVAVEVLSEYPERLMCSLVKPRIKKLLKELRQYSLASSLSPKVARQLGQETAAVGNLSQAAGGQGRD